MSEKILQARTKNQKHCNKTALEDYNKEHYNNQDINLVSKNYITTTKRPKNPNWKDTILRY